MQVFDILSLARSNGHIRGLNYMYIKNNNYMYNKYMCNNYMYNKYIIFSNKIIVLFIIALFLLILIILIKIMEHINCIISN
jgi:hypothetical protein